jgi:hypothetical protein
MSKVFEEQAIRFLRGEENPFDAFVVPDKPAHEFPQCHVQEVHGDQFEQIGRVIDKYRFPDYRMQRQLYDTRVLIVRGTRGSGKTHLLHVLRQRDTPTPEIWVCPRYFDPAFPFSEYLLTELVRTLLSSEEAEATARLRWCARELTRRMLVEAVESLDLPQWLQWSLPASDAWNWLRRTARRQADRERLLDDLAAGPFSTPLAEVCVRHGLSPAAAFGLVMRHVERTELGTGTPVRMRREVLLAFAELALRSWRTGNPRMLPKTGQAPGVHAPEPVPFSASPKMGQAPSIHASEPVPFSEAGQAPGIHASEPVPFSERNPFDEPYEHEQVVVDCYASLLAIHGGDGPATRKQSEIAAAMQTIFENAVQYVEPPDEPAVASVAELVAEPVTAPAADDIEDQVLQTLAELGLNPSETIEPPVLCESPDEDADEACIPLETVCEENESSGVQVVRTLPADDNDMIVVVDDQRGETPLRSSGGIGHRQEYRQLFSRLRRS